MPHAAAFQRAAVRQRCGVAVPALALGALWIRANYAEVAGRVRKRGGGLVFRRPGADILDSNAEQSVSIGVRGLAGPDLIG